MIILSNLTGFGTAYFYIAIFFSVIFVIQTILTFIGMGDSFELDADYDGDVDADIGVIDVFGLTFHLFTIRGIIAFGMMFGWVGYSMEKAGNNTFVTLLVSFLAGFIMMVLMGLLYSFVSKLASSGNIDLRSAIGKTAEVYLTIPGARSGHGKVHITIDERLREVEAVTNDDKLNNGEEVEVIDVINNVFVVKRKENT